MSLASSSGYSILKIEMFDVLLTFDSFWYWQGSAIFNRQGSVAPFHALALEKETQPSDDDRQDAEVDFLANENRRSHTPKKASNIEEGIRALLSASSLLAFPGFAPFFWLEFVLQQSEGRVRSPWQ